MNKEWVARELTMEVIVGAFMVMVLLGMGYFTIILSKENFLTGKKERLEVVFNNIMGLSKGDRVVVRGMAVGKVKNFDLQKDGVHVHAILEHPIPLRNDYKVTVVTSSVLGGRYLEVNEGTEKAGELVLGDGQYLKGTDPFDLVADAAEMINALKNGLTQGNIIDNFRKTMEDIRQISDRLNTGKGTLGKLLSEDDKLYKDLSDTIASLKTVTGRFEKGEGTLGKLMSPDDKMYRDLSETIVSLKTVSARLEKGEGTIGKLLSPDDKLYKDLADSVASLKNITTGLEKGDGMLGKLLKDEKMYQDIQAIVGEARATIEDFRETAPITTFTSIFFGAF